MDDDSASAPQETLRRRIEQLRADAIKQEPGTESSADQHTSANDTKADADADTKMDTTADTKTDAAAAADAADTKPAIKTENMDVDPPAAVKTEPDAAPQPGRFSGLPTSAPVRLEVIRPVVKKNYVRYPLYSKFRAGGRWSMLVLPNWELRQLARKKGQKVVDGFNYSAKVRLSDSVGVRFVT